MFKTLSLCLLALISIVNAQELMDLEWDQKWYGETKIDSPLCEKAPVLAYHIHAMVWPHVPRQLNQVIQWQNDFIDHFGIRGQRNCTFDSANPAPEQQTICAWPIDFEPVGPFNYAQLSFHVPKHKFTEVYEYAMHTRNGLDILLHPKTGCDIQDHTLWSSWTG